MNHLTILKWFSIIRHMLIINILILAGSGLLIFKTTDWFVRGTVDIASALRLPKVFIALTLVSIMTTAPEFIVSVFSSYIGEPGVAVGNALGSCICNIGLVFAVGVLIKKIVAEKEDFLYKITFLLLISLLMAFFTYDGIITKFESIFLIILLVAFLGVNFYIGIKGKVSIEKNEEAKPEDKKHLLRNGAFFFLIGGLGTVLLARFGLLNSGIAIAHALGAPPILVGLTLIAIGTSLPELFTAIIAAKKGHSDIALGNVIGANTLNLLWVLGAAGLVNPLPIDTETIQFTLPSVIALTVLLFVLGITNRTYDRKEGIVLLLGYITYIVTLIFFIY